MCFFTNTQSRFASVVLSDEIGLPHLALHTHRCPSISEVPNATYEARQGAPEEAVLAQKALHEAEI